MRTATELKEDILRITMSIKDKYPELSRSIQEIWVETETGYVNNMDLLNNYFNTLNEQLYNYDTNNALK